MDADSTTGQIVKRNEEDDAIMTNHNQEMELTTVLLRSAVERERDIRKQEKITRFREEQLMDEERRRLDEDMKWERDEARRKLEVEEMKAAERERRAFEREERIIAELMMREEALRAREREFMAYWEKQRLLAQKRALKWEDVVMATDRAIRTLSAQMVQRQRVRRRKEVTDAILLTVALVLVSATASLFCYFL